MMTVTENPKLHDFTSLTWTDKMHVGIALEYDDQFGNKHQLPFISCHGLSFNDNFTMMWNNTDIKHPDDPYDYRKSFQLPIIGFSFAFWSSGIQTFTAWVEPNPSKYRTLSILPVNACTKRTIRNTIMANDHELMNTIRGQKLIIRVSSRA